MKKSTFLLEAVSFLAAFLLLREWLAPIAELSNIGYIQVFYVFVALCFVLLFLHVPWWISGILKVLYMYWFIISVYTMFPLFSQEANGYFIYEWTFNLGQLIQGDLTQMTNPFRTLLFFVLLWMTVYLIGYWIRMRTTVFLFFLVTILIISVLDTFTPYDGAAAIVRVFIIGLGTSAFLFVSRLHDKQERVKWRGLGFTALLLLFSVGLAVLLPKAGPLWPDPVPYFTSTNPTSGVGPGGEGGINKVGYDDDDTRLGGSFLSDDTEVFQVTATSRNYYRGETKDTYTSKGWIQSEPQMDYSYFRQRETFDLGFPQNDDGVQETLQFVMQTEFPFLFHTYGAEVVDGQSNVFDVRLNERSQRLDAVVNDEAVSIDSYSVQFSEPSYLLSELRSTDINALPEIAPEFSRFLQLPDTLPQRVRDLAVEITNGQDNVYDQAKSIEQYFRTNGFSYSQNDVAVPEGDTDYVDQFLFDTKVGYCDNFSTSMVVLLRSVDIPARWVKGFAPGEVISTENGEQVFQVTNNNAHSWVEAYMPGIGWMTFEPTIGFTNTPDIEFDIELSPDDALAAEQQQELEEQTPEQNQEDTTTARSSSSFSFDAIAEWFDRVKWWIFGVLAVLLAGSALAYRYRLKWLPKFWIARYKKNEVTSEQFEKMYKVLLKSLHQYGLPRENGFTLTRYAKQIDGYFGGDHMMTLTKEYEQILYGNKPLQDGERLRESWEYLINRISG
ncbi:DUF3488 and DUF4129 domain-containing transglutaminase family protein [Chryseomicrobium palamuruense]|uniref:DUF3488 and DUF4129 domain-containing transglutaminase family protein n=1 Tax=Chryseomicrobium palamuruense TaxID=682973 RepID=A0ABV8UTW7_9BACL